jgi:CheY-like chemotaxis protein
MPEAKLLVIDDEDLVRRTVDTALKRHGYDVVLACDAFEGLEKAREGRFDLIISDIKMPGRNGVEGIKEIRRLFDESGIGDVPIIFITGYANLGEELNAEKLGEIILKPFDVEHLLATIREYL